MKYFGYMPNDFINGQGVCVSLWTSGCPHHCKGCHNQEMWDFENGYEIPYDIKDKLKKAITDNGINRNFSILGGEPMCEQNLDFVLDIIEYIRKEFKNIKIFIWSGYTITELKKANDKRIDKILSLVDVLIDGRYIEELRDVSLPLRGSSNQKILIKNKDF